MPDINKYKSLLKENVSTSLGGHKINLNDPIFHNDMKGWLKQHLTVSVHSQDCFNPIQIAGRQINSNVVLHVGILVDGEIVTSSSVTVRIQW